MIFPPKYLNIPQLANPSATPTRLLPTSKGVKEINLIIEQKAFMGRIVTEDVNTIMMPLLLLDFFRFSSTKMKI